MAENSNRRDADPLAFLAGVGEMSERTRAFDWSQTALGPGAGWPQALKTALRIMLNTRYPMALMWGRRLTFFYNDAYTPVLGHRHPAALGQPAAEVWSEIWDTLGPQADIVLNEGRATWNEEQLLPMERNGFPEETYFTYSYSPVPDDRGGVGGLLITCTEDTHRVVSQRRLRTLRSLGERAAEAKTAQGACGVAAATLSENPHDIPFALLYLLDADGRRVTLAGASGVGWDSPASPAEVELDAPGSPWPFREAVRTGKPVEVFGLTGTFGPLPGGPWPEPPQRAVVLPMSKAGQARPAGFLVAGVSPRLAFTDEYSGFLELLARHVAAAVANARAYEEERQRAEALAELDRAKTAFFSNVSHEFRTPLTLMLGPAEDALADTQDALPPAQRERVEVIHRNGLRLQRLVNTLLDFSRIEAGRLKAAYEPTDLASFTADLASNFRSACEKAGLTLTVDCPPLSEPVFVDRQMYEKIVLNLLSNAFKFTLEGGIGVSVRRAGPAAEVRVTDTGTGIPAEEMPRLFERFHRVGNARGRTHEGSGIGLALVQELVNIHGGTIAAASEVGTGTTFTLTLPLGSGHLPPEQVGPGGTTAPAAGASPFVEEALRWLPEAAGQDAPGPARPEPPNDLSERVHSPGPDARRPRVLVADDNADMRGYVRRLLSGQYTVEAVADGAAALDAVRRQPPELVLSDVMMPRLDGFGLLKALRADPRTAGVPVVLLSARAGEESRVEGLRAGADDYLVKPFSARELLVRVAALLHVTRLRREAGEAIRASEERFRTLFDSMDEAFCVVEMIYNEDRRPVDYRFLEANPTFEKHTGFTDALGRTIRELVPDHDAHWFEIYGRVAATGQPIRFVNEAKAMGRWYDVYAYRAGGDGSNKVGILFTDITERKAAEAERVRLLAELEAKTAFIQAVIRQVPVGILVAEAGTDRLLLSNDEAGRISGIRYEPGLPVSDNDARYPVKGYRPDGRTYGTDDWPLARALRGELVQGEEIELRRGDSSRLTIRVNATPIRDPAGAVAAAVVAFHDVTAEKQAEQALRDADRRKDEFLATLAHELRNPLAPIRNGLQILRLSNGERETVERVRDMMERQLGQMVRLVDDLLDLSRISRGKIDLRKERVELASVVREAVETSRPLIEGSGHDLTIALPPRPVYVNADTTRLAQVVSNLLNNAAKYTDRGGRVALTVRREGGEAVVSVRDTGIGIPAHMLPRVWDIFTQVDRNLERSQGGLGIGLSIVKKLVEMHGGTVEGRSDGLGTGSEFVVRLPVVRSPAAKRKAAGGEAVCPADCRVLVVDDNRDAATSLATVLDLMGISTRTAFDGPEALDVAASFRPDLILLDIGMPRMNGYDTARHIRGQPWGTGVVLVALTGWGQDEDRRKSQEAGFDSHMTKPIEPAALEKLLASLRSDAG